MAGRWVIIPAPTLALDLIPSVASMACSCACSCSRPPIRATQARPCCCGSPMHIYMYLYIYVHDFLELFGRATPNRTALTLLPGHPDGPVICGVRCRCCRGTRTGQ